MLSAAAIAAKHTSALCNVCRVASNKTSNAVTKKHFIQSAKDIAQATGDMVKKVKVIIVKLPLVLYKNLLWFQTSFYLKFNNKVLLRLILKIVSNWKSSLCWFFDTFMLDWCKVWVGLHVFGI